MEKQKHTKNTDKNEGTAKNEGKTDALLFTFKQTLHLSSGEGGTTSALP